MGRAIIARLLISPMNINMNNYQLTMYHNLLAHGRKPCVDLFSRLKSRQRQPELTPCSPFFLAATVKRGELLLREWNLNLVNAKISLFSHACLYTILAFKPSAAIE
jgi:hypothetical protein